MKRTRALFRGSRLYRQAMEGSERLLSALSQGNVFGKEIGEVSDSERILIENPTDTRRWLKATEEHAWHVSRQLSPDIALCVLLQAIMSHYYGGQSQTPSTLGWFLKRTLELVARNVFHQHFPQTKALRRIEQAVRATALFSQLQDLTFLFEEFSEDGDELVIHASGRQASHRLNEVINRFTAPMPAHDRFMRTLASTQAAIWRSLKTSMIAVENVLRGEDPKDQSAFSGTLLQRLSIYEPREFWAGIWSRLHLAVYCQAIRQTVTEDTLSIAIFEPFAIAPPPGVERDLIQAAVHELFWDRNWYFRTCDERPANMLVERPGVTISVNPKLHSTSSLLVGDSLNSFIESAINLSPRSQVRLSDNVFRELISEPFEESVIELFRVHGFLAGRVSPKGVWVTQNGSVLLYNLTQMIPGEIDMLAFHEPSSAVVIIECKVISGPFHVNSMRNILRKLGPLDQEQFHSKLAKKIKWIRTTTRFTHLPENSFLGMLLLDVKMRWIPRAKYPVIDFQQLSQFMSKVEPIELIGITR